MIFRYNSLKSMTKLSFFFKITVFFIFLLVLSSCEALKYKKTKAGEVPVNADDRVAKNIEEGRGFRLFGNNKNKGGNFLNAKKMPLMEHEIVSVFYNKPPTYNPQMQKRAPSGLARVKSSGIIGGSVKVGSVYGKSVKSKTIYGELRNPSSHQRFKVERGKHPTQKPVPLMEYLIKTYTNENETVLDFTMGSGSTGVAAKNLNRSFIGIEQDKKYFNIATERINKEQPKKELF